MDVPFLPYSQLKAAAAETLANSKFGDRFPVAIEMIVERCFRMDVVPIRGLRSGFNIDAFISQDLATISVDEYVLDNYLNRYRFSLAHELGHRVLHRDILGAMKFRSIADWKLQITQFPEKEYRILEYQANTFANCLLVPADQLDRRFDDAVDHIRSNGVTPSDCPDFCLDAIAAELSDQFEVSSDAILRRLTHKQEDFQSRLR
jgi:hypothetical protein